ncbi:MAG: uroporphyrinogen decarboxylase [Planctomycetes bacterium]|nr:uroporphyrinogen decarboxylase [Planctomycetota bacterium]
MFLRACRGEETEATPIWLMRQAGRYLPEYRALRERVGFLDLCRRSDLAAQVTVDAARRLGVDAAIVFADLLLVLEPLGLEVEFGPIEGPIIRNPLREGADVERLREMDAPSTLRAVYETVRLSRAALPAGVPLIGFCGAPFTVGAYAIEGRGSRDFAQAKAFIYRDPGAWHALAAHLVRGLTDYLNAQIDAGAHAVQVFDSWVGCLGPADYRSFVLPHTRALIRGLRPGVPVIHFGTGNPALVAGMAEAGGEVVGLDHRSDLAGVRARLGARAVQGNLDPAVLLADRPAVIERATGVLEANGGRPGHVFNLGHGVLPETPVDNVLALVDHVRAWRPAR